MQLVVGAGSGGLIAPQREASAMSPEGNSNTHTSTLILLIFVGVIGIGCGIYWSRAGRRQEIEKK
jgi:hypothetical protein